MNVLRHALFFRNFRTIPWQLTRFGLEEGTKMASTSCYQEQEENKGAFNYSNIKKSWHRCQ